MIYTRFTVEVDDTYEAVHMFMMHRSVQIQYFRSFVPPNRVTYLLGPFQNEDGAARIEKEFSKTGCKYKCDTYVVPLNQENISV